MAKSGANGEGVDYEVSFSNLPQEGGPFSMSSSVNVSLVYQLTFVKSTTSTSPLSQKTATVPARLATLTNISEAKPPLATRHVQRRANRET